jgi:predicted NBD/HSP70 family sugar kinase
MVELDGRGVCGIGVELNVDYAAVLALDLRGGVVFQQRVGLDVPGLGPERTLDEVARLVREALTTAVAAGSVPVGLSVAVPGLVQRGAGVVTLAPNIGWQDVPLVDALRARLGGVDLPIRVENDANLSAIAEWAMGSEAGSPDLLYLTGEVGVGGGVIVAGQLLRGHSGLGGEVGHMSLGSADHVCGCGRRGCWETVVGLAALLRAAADEDDPVRDPTRDLETRLAEVLRRADAGDERTLAALRQIGRDLGIGASVLVNVVNPQVLVLGGYFAVVARHLMEPLTAELEARVFGPGVAGVRVVPSTLGFTAAGRGGAYVALGQVFDDPTSVPAGAPAAPALPGGGAR